MNIHRIKNHERRYSPDRLVISIAFAAVCAALLFFAQGCQPAPEEVETASMTEGQDLAEGDQAEGQDVQVTVGGPAAWSCQRYLDLSDDTSEHFDQEAAEEAEEYVADLLRAAEAEETPSLARPDVPLRTALRDACSERSSELFSTVVNETMATDATPTQEPG